jgi:hypothetical protein
MYRRPHMRFSKFQNTPTWNKLMNKAYEDFGPRYRSKVAGMGHYQPQSYCGLPAQDRLRAAVRRNAKSNGWGWTAEMYVLQSPVLSPSELVRCGAR